MSLMYGRNPSYGSYGSFGKTGRRRAGLLLFGGLFRKKKAVRSLYAGSFSGVASVRSPRRQSELLRVVRKGFVAGAEGALLTQGALKGALAAAKNVDRRKLRFEFGPGTVMVGLMAVAIGLGLLYLAHFNLVATRGYEVTRLQADREQLLTQYEIKNMKLAEVRSLTNIAATDRVSAMRHPSSVEYVRGDSALALK